MKKILFVVFALFLLIALTIQSSYANSPVREQSVIGENAPQFTISDIDGNKLTLDSLVEKYSAVVLNFWGLRCGACIQEMPHLNDMYKKYNGKITILGVNVDAADGAFLKEHMKKMQIVMDYVVVPDPEFTMSDTYNLEAAPLTIVIDGDGKVRYRHENYEPGDEKELDKIIQDILDGKKVVAK
jgi:peroxiredoxin